MKEILIVMFAAVALVGCNNAEQSAIEQGKDSAKDQSNAQDSSVGSRARQDQESYLISTALNPRPSLAQQSRFLPPQIPFAPNPSEKAG